MRALQTYTSGESARGVTGEAPVLMKRLVKKSQQRVSGRKLDSTDLALEIGNSVRGMIARGIGTEKQMNVRQGNEDHEHSFINIPLPFIPLPMILVHISGFRSVAAPHAGQENFF